jgi:serine/threonine protein kinase
MGAVYEAQHLVVKRRFAVKFLRADLARRRDALQRFKREAEATGALEGENIAAAVDFGVADDGAPYIVMQYLDGVDLGTLLGQEGPLPLARAAELVVQACRGMQEAHAAGVVHRDLKPRNLFVCRRGDGTDLLKIVDFGVAKLLLDDPTSQVTRTGSMVGTPSYMSPEQARGETAIDARADVHALGVIFYELLTGRTPYRGDSFHAVIHQIATQPPLPLECEGREFPPELVKVVERALSSDPAARPQSAGQLGLELAPFARREAWPDPTEHARSVAVSPIETSDELGSPPQGRGRLVTVAGLLATGALLGAIWLLTRSSPSVEPAEKGTLAPRDERPRDTATAAVASPVPPSPAALDPSPAAPSHAGTIAPDPILVGPPSPRSDSATSGRSPGRPPTSASPSPTRSKPVVSDEVTATFDKQNPYE